jgi:hypothetical protein
MSAAGRVDVSAQCPVRPLASGPEAYFFGYYYYSPWDADSRRCLALRTAHRATMPAPGETAEVGWLEHGSFHRLAVTRAWNWQQGCGLRWLPGSDHARIAYNDLRDGAVRGVLLDVNTGSEQILPRAAADLSDDGRWAVSLDYARLAQARPVVGYGQAAAVDVAQVPDDDGVWLIDLASGAERLLLSLRQAVDLHEGPDFATAAAAPAYAGRPGYEQPGRGHRFDGAKFSPDATRVLIGHRWPRRAPLELPHFQRHFWDRLLLCPVAGGAPARLGEDGFFSHTIWQDERSILSWCHWRGVAGLWRIDADHQQATAVLPELITEDPHASFSPDGRWLLGDGYPQREAGREPRRPLWICDLARGIRHDIGAFASPAPFDRGAIRCDLHPRWSPDGRQVCIDSVHEGVRRMYAIDVAAVVDP